MGGRLRATARRHVALGGVAAAVAAVTAANRIGLVEVRALASTPQATLAGRVWLLATSAFLADRPTAPSLVAFAAFGVLALRLCGPRATWASAAIGHVGSAAAMYGFIAAVRAVVPAAFESVLSLPDYGTSAIIAAWLGVMSATGWQKHSSPASRLGIAAFCAFAGFVGWLFRPDLTPLDFEHVIAFALGVGVVGVHLPRLPALEHVRLRRTRLAPTASVGEAAT